jgi:predicted nucleic acid-binding protein
LNYTPKVIDFSIPYVCDKKDEPIIASAILAQPDVLISGDKDFFTKEIREYFAVYTPADFFKYFSST